MPKTSKYNLSRVNNLGVFGQKKINEEEKEDMMELDVEPDLNNNHQEIFFSSDSESDESDFDDFFPEEEMVTVDISLISQLVEFIQNSKPTKRWISVLVYGVLR